MKITSDRGTTAFEQQHHGGLSFLLSSKAKLVTPPSISSFTTRLVIERVTASNRVVIERVDNF